MLGPGPGLQQVFSRGGGGAPFAHPKRIESLWSATFSILLITLNNKSWIKHGLMTCWGVAARVKRNNLRRLSIAARGKVAACTVHICLVRALYKKAQYFLEEAWDPQAIICSRYSFIMPPDMSMVTLCILMCLRIGDS